GVGARTVPIGRPLANGSCYVLDEIGNPAPVGVVGELYIGGEGVARGYLGRPEQTAEPFVPLGLGDCGLRIEELSIADCGLRIADSKQSHLSASNHLSALNPQSAIRNPQLGIRVYRTGDLVRWGKD